MLGVSNFVRQTLFAQALYATLHAGGAGSAVRLYQNNFTPGPTSRLQDFQECDFNGYAAESGADFFGPVLDPLNGGYLVSCNAVLGFVCGGLPPAQLAYGWFITDLARSTHYGFGIFETPITFDQFGQELYLVPTLSIPVNSGFV